MRKLLLAGLLAASQAYAADDPKVVQLQAELAAVKEQRNAALDQVASIVAAANQRIEALQKQVADLTPKPKGDEKK